MVDSCSSSAVAVRFHSATPGLFSSASLLNSSAGCLFSFVDSCGGGAQQQQHRRISQCVCYHTRHRYPRLTNDSYSRRRQISSSTRVRATADQLGSDSDNAAQVTGNSVYHPSEDIGGAALLDGNEARLTASETAQTIIQVNSKATIMFSGMVDDDIHHNIFWPDLPYVTDEHGNIYFQVSDDENIMQSLTTDDNVVQVIIGFDTVEMLKEMEDTTQELELEEIEEGDSEFDEDGSSDDDGEDGDYDGDWTAILDDEDDEDSDETVGDWAKLETMSSTHPMYFAKRLAEVTSDDPVDWTDQPPAGLVIQGILRPVLNEDQSIIQKRISEQLHNLEREESDPIRINGHQNELVPLSGSVGKEDMEKDDSPPKGNSFYKLNLIRIQLMSAHGQQADIEIEDFMTASPDAIAHSADKIISRIKEEGDKITQAFKSLCWRLKGIQVEEAILMGIDSLGIDLRVCSGRQVQTLRFGFNTRATSEYSAERQLNDLLFPPTSKLSKKKQAR